MTPIPIDNDRRGIDEYLCRIDPAREARIRQLAARVAAEMVRAPKPKPPPKPRGTPVRLMPEGTPYPSIRVMAESLGVCRSAVRNHLRVGGRFHDGTWPEYVGKPLAVAPTSFTGCRNACPLMRVRDGKRFRSASAVFGAEMADVRHVCGDAGDCG